MWMTTCGVERISFLMTERLILSVGIFSCIVAGDRGGGDVGEVVGTRQDQVVARQ